jgi:hypothetical protein
MRRHSRHAFLGAPQGPVGPRLALSTPSPLMWEVGRGQERLCGPRLAPQANFIEDLLTEGAKHHLGLVCIRSFLGHLAVRWAGLQRCDIKTDMFFSDLPSLYLLGRVKMGNFGETFGVRIP